MSARCSTPTSMCVSARELLLYVCASACMCVCVCVFFMFASVCQRERERARERASERASERARERESERERETEHRRVAAVDGGARHDERHIKAAPASTGIVDHSIARARGRQGQVEAPGRAVGAEGTQVGIRGAENHAPLAQSRMRAALAACPRAPRFDVRIGLAAQARDALVKVL